MCVYDAHDSGFQGVVSITTTSDARGLAEGHKDLLTDARPKGVRRHDRSHHRRGRLVPGIERLQRLAERTEGTFIDATAGDDLPGTLPVADVDDAPDNMKVEGRDDIALWNGWSWALLLLLSFGGEWVLRRRSGLA